MAAWTDVRWRPAAGLGAMACALACAPAALAAPPQISGTDGEVWNRPPVYTVTGEAGSTYGWTNPTTLQLGRRQSAPFTISLSEGIRDGRHVLVVWREREDDEDRSESATRTFVVDRTPPGPLTIAGPATVTAGRPVTFGWSGGEAGARFVWRIDAPTGQIQGPVDTASPVASPAPLQPGAYTLVVRQIDLAGNLGPEAAAAFAVVAPVPPAPPAAPAPAPATPPSPIASGALPLPVGPVQVTIKLPSANAGRLRPRLAAVVRTRRPVLRWKRGPRGTKLYNVQIFRVDASRVATSNSVRLRKLRSVFPRRNRLRTPRLRLGACYVWRVWPYRNDDFTKKPLGVSNFCVAARRRAS